MDTAKKIAAQLSGFFKSLKLAVLVLSALAVLTAIGTFVESRYDQQAANKLIYHSPWMGAALMFLALNLFAVLTDRWPWKKRQAGFVAAHIGILTMILGSFVTKYLGIDGSLRFREGETVRTAGVPEMEIKIYSSFDGQSFSLLHEEDVDFFLRRPSESRPFEASAGGESFIVDSYLPYSLPRRVYKQAEKGGRPALRFHIEGRMGADSGWLYIEPGEASASSDLGPVSITLTEDPSYKGSKNRELVFLSKSHPGNPPQLLYFFSEKPPPKKTRHEDGTARPPRQTSPAKPGARIKTPWMDFQLQLLDFLPRASKRFLVTPAKAPSDLTVQAIRARRRGQPASQAVWALENSPIRFYQEDRVHVFGFLNKRVSLGFDLKLLDFRIAHYQGSGKAKSYESEVEFDGQSRLISMNEPLKHKGFTFYQSSFETDRDGQARTSILSVNRDPGRPLKYGGALLVVAGIVLLFWLRRV